MFRRDFSFPLVVLVHLCFTITTCKAITNQNCNIPPSSCGDIRNISFPFRLKTDPESCGLPDYELACENNQTILYINSKEYYVLSINYQNYTIRILDPRIQKNHCPSFPLHSSVNDQDVLPKTIYEDLKNGDNGIIYPYDYPEGIDMGIFITCPRKVENSLYVDTTASCNTKNISSNTSSYSYVLIGEGYDDETVANVEDSCMISEVAFFSSEFSSKIDNTSSLSILDRMSNEFTLLWYRVYCEKCNSNEYCYLDEKNNVECETHGQYTKFSGIYNRLWRIKTDRLPELWWKYVFSKFYYYHHQDIVGLQDVLYISFLIVFELTLFCLTVRFMFGLLCYFILIVYKIKRRHLSNDDNIEHFLQAQQNLMPIRYEYSEIRTMTNKFKHKLGEGGFGSVFKGKLRSGIFVAVKMLNKSNASGQEFINEVATIGTIHHVNVVQLIGFCVEGSKRALVYEFMPNGSLEKYIFSQEGDTIISLSYEKMFEISLGVARGIDYLHRGCQMQILHFDIKPHNILLDDNFNPKVSDFGLAKLYSTDDSIVSLTAARGTMGYMAPELFYKNIGGVSYKADVYSYGMLLLEMAGKRKNLNPFMENLSQIYFPSWVYDQFSAGKEIGTEETSGEEKKMVKKMIIVGLWCIQMKPIDRPSMNKIVEMLEGDDQHLQMPPKPFLYPEQSQSEEDHEIHENENELPLMSFSDSARLHGKESYDNI